MYQFPLDFKDVRTESLEVTAVLCTLGKGMLKFQQKFKRVYNLRSSPNKIITPPLSKETKERVIYASLFDADV